MAPFDSEGQAIQPPVYVTQPQLGQAVGWSAVEKAVREDDEHQVRSCKEDIDTLLTFVRIYYVFMPEIVYCVRDRLVCTLRH